MQPVNLDRVDKCVLLELSRSGRITNAELAEAVHLSATAVGRRQKALEASGVIRGYGTDINVASFGYTMTVVVQVTLESQAESHMRAFESAVRECDGILRCYLLSGAQDYLLILLVRDLAGFERIHKEELSRLPHVARIQSSFAMRDVVQRMLPPELLREFG